MTRERAAAAPAVVGTCKRLYEQFPQAGLRPVQLLREESFEAIVDPKRQTRVWLALESLQVTGSFKVRGALWALDAERRRGARVVVTASAGNHGAGVAFAAAVLGMSAIVCVPSSSPRVKVQRIREHGADVRLIDGGYDQAEVVARELATREAVPFVSPYDAIEVAVGNGSSLGFEIVEALGRVPEHVVCPIGGGGLATGLAWALSVAAGDDTRHPGRLWTAQSEASAAFALSVEAGHAVETLAPSQLTLAEGLEGGISSAAFARASCVVRGVSVVPERQIGEAMTMLWDRGLRVEGSAAVALAPVIFDMPPLLRGGDLVVVLTGRNVDVDVLRRVVAACDGG